MSAGAWLGPGLLLLLTARVGGGQGKVGCPSTRGTLSCMEKGTFCTARLLLQGLRRSLGLEELRAVGRLELSVENAGSYKAVVPKQAAQRKIQRITPRVSTTDICLDKKKGPVTLRSALMLQHAIAVGWAAPLWRQPPCCPAGSGPSPCRVRLTQGTALHFVRFVAPWEIFHGAGIFPSGTQWQKLNQEQWEQSRTSWGHCFVSPPTFCMLNS